MEQKVKLEAERARLRLTADRLRSLRGEIHWIQGSKSLRISANPSAMVFMHRAGIIEGPAYGLGVLTELGQALYAVGEL
jgi:hypothetical protein